MKRFAVLIITFFMFFTGYAQNQNSNLLVKFIKGNIAEKNEALKEAEGNESIQIADRALEFALTNKEYLGNDKDLDNLVVTAVLSYTPEYVYNETEKEKDVLMNKFISVFNKFPNSSIVQIAILSKIVSLKDIVNTNSFTQLLNQYLSTINYGVKDSSIVKAAFASLEFIGNNESFVLLYNLSNNPKYDVYDEEIEEALISLIPVSVSEILELVRIGNLTQINKVLNLCKKNKQISPNILNEIAENILNESIILADNSSIDFALLTSVQMDSLKILNDNKCTRSAPTVLKFFSTAKLEYSAQLLTESQFMTVVSSLSVIAPLTAVIPLTNCLEELNVKKEAGDEVSELLVLSIIRSLGAIGDKTAFDSLLAVTYLNYSEAVLTAARGALAGLRW